MKRADKQELDQRYRTFKHKLNLVGKLKPREEYLYPIIKGVPFNDTETALDIAIVNYGEKVQELTDRQDIITQQEKTKKGR